MLNLSKVVASAAFKGPMTARALHLTPVVERARQMTRIRKRKQAVKNKKAKEERLKKAPPHIPKRIKDMLMEKGLWPDPKPLREVDDKPFASDSVYLSEYFTWKRWSLEEAIQELRLHNHPSLLNRPNAIVEAKIEFDLRSTKKDRYLDDFSKMVPIWHYYDRGVSQSTVMAFAADEEGVKMAEEAGAVKAGLPHLISEIAKGRVDITDIDFFVAHEDVSQHLNQLINVLRDKTPRVQQGTVGNDLPLLVKTFSSGMVVDVKKPKPEPGIKNEPDYGYCVAPIGTLDMEELKMGENLDAILEKVEENRPKRKDPADTRFITRCIVRVQGDEDDNVAQFSIRRQRVFDKKGDTQEAEVQKGKDLIEKKIEEIRARQR